LASYPTLEPPEKARIMTLPLGAQHSSAIVSFLLFDFDRVVL